VERMVMDNISREPVLNLQLCKEHYKREYAACNFNCCNKAEGRLKIRWTYVY